MGHLARDCNKVAAGRMSEGGAKEPNLRQEEQNGPRCHSCHCFPLVKEKMTGGEVSVQCAHGDIVSYPLAQVEIRVGESQYLVEAAV